METTEFSPFIHPKEFNGSKFFHLKILVGCFTVLPLRVLSLVILLPSLWLVSQLALYGVLSPNRSKIIIRQASRIICSLGLFLLGFLRIKKTGQLNKRAKTIVSNHLSYIDMLYFISECAPSFVAKDSIQNVAFIGTIANALQCIYTSHARGDNSQLVNGADKIRNRQKFLASNQEAGPLLIFPEGTTTNGTAIIHFRRGGFLGGPVQPVVIRYPYNCFSVTWETIPMSYHVFRLFTEFVHSMEVVYLPVYFPSAEELADPQLYANNVQRLMAENLKVPATSHTIKEKLEYHKLIISGKLSWK